jgi:hypothetical protein
MEMHVREWGEAPSAKSTERVHVAPSVSGAPGGPDGHIEAAHLSIDLTRPQHEHHGPTVRPAGSRLWITSAFPSNTRASVSALRPSPARPGIGSGGPDCAPASGQAAMSSHNSMATGRSQRTY